MKILSGVLLAAAAALMMTGCEMVDSQMLQQLREYFPQAEIVHPQPDILGVVTHVPNVTEKFVQQTVATLLREHCCHQGGFAALANQDLDAILPAAGYSSLIIVFDSVGCYWEPNNLQTFRCRTMPSAQNEVHVYPIHDQVNIIPPVILPAPGLRPLPVPRRH